VPSVSGASVSVEGELSWVVPVVGLVVVGWVIGNVNQMHPSCRVGVTGLMLSGI